MAGEVVERECSNGDDNARLQKTLKRNLSDNITLTYAVPIDTLGTSAFIRDLIEQGVLGVRVCGNNGTVQVGLRNSCNRLNCNLSSICFADHAPFSTDNLLFNVALLRSKNRRWEILKLLSEKTAQDPNQLPKLMGEKLECGLQYSDVDFLDMLTGVKANLEVFEMIKNYNGLGVMMPFYELKRYMTNLPVDQVEIVSAINQDGVEQFLNKIEVAGSFRYAKALEQYFEAMINLDAFPLELNSENVRDALNKLRDFVYKKKDRKSIMNGSENIYRLLNDLKAEGRSLNIHKLRKFCEDRQIKFTIGVINTFLAFRNHILGKKNAKVTFCQVISAMEQCGQLFDMQDCLNKFHINGKPAEENALRLLMNKYGFNMQIIGQSGQISVYRNEHADLAPTPQTR